MSRAVVFVHGTGVRGDAYRRSFAQVKDALAELDRNAVLGGCYWGGEHGAALALDGASIPIYADTGGEPPSTEEQDLALWAVLYTDPWYELRLLRYAGTGVRNLPRAQQYCDWLARQTGVSYRLPTSTQWEKAARGTDRRRFPWGETLDPSRCAYRRRTTVPVTQYSPAGDSPYGVADLVGNAREWTSTMTPSKGINMTTTIVRGGGILASRDWQLWCSYLTEITTGPKATIGFRVAVG